MDIEEIVSQSSYSMLEGKIDSKILTALKSMGIDKPTRIQAEALPHLLRGKDIIGAAKTGSGKTLAFLIPVVEKLISMKMTTKEGTGCIILSPTRELALQTFEVLKKLLVNIDLSYCLIVGGEKKAKDILKLKKGVNIIVSTPGRLLDHLQNTENFNCRKLKILVLDEADKLLEAGFEKHITGIINLLPTKRQTVLFSATMGENVKNLARLAMSSDPVLISVTDNKMSTVSGLQQGFYICPVEKRISWLYKMLKKSKKMKVMVFFSSCRSVDFHYEFFRAHCKASVMSIHGQQSQAKRKETYHNFVEAQNGVLFCTDVAARGLDIPCVDWIVQYDPPSDPKEYIHRVGRTARGLNNTGNAVILLRPEEEQFIEFLKKEMVYLDKYTFDTPSDEVQTMLEDLISNNGVMKTLARKAYLSFLRCYKTHPLKRIFNIKSLDLKLAAKAFGFQEQPHVDFSDTYPGPSSKTLTWSVDHPAAFMQELQDNTYCPNVPIEEISSDWKDTGANCQVLGVSAENYVAGMKEVQDFTYCPDERVEEISSGVRDTNASCPVVGVLVEDPANGIKEIQDNTYCPNVPIDEISSDWKDTGANCQVLGVSAENYVAGMKEVQDFTYCPDERVEEISSGVRDTNASCPVVGILVEDPANGIKEIQDNTYCPNVPIDEISSDWKDTGANCQVLGVSAEDPVAGMKEVQGFPYCPDEPNIVSMEGPEEELPENNFKIQSRKLSIDSNFVKYCMDFMSQEDVGDFSSGSSDLWSPKDSENESLSEQEKKQKKKQKKIKKKASTKEQTPIPLIKTKRTNKEKMRKILQSKGLSYEARSGRIKEAKLVQTNPCQIEKCLRKCYEIPEERRKSLFEYFWSLESQQKKEWIVQCAQRVAKERKKTDAAESRRSSSFIYYINEGEGRRQVC